MLQFYRGFLKNFHHGTIDQLSLFLNVPILLINKNKFQKMEISLFQANTNNIIIFNKFAFTCEYLRNLSILTNLIDLMNRSTKKLFD
jgi:hypothetical protein